MGNHLVDPITFMDDVKNSKHTYEDGMIHLEHCVTRTWKQIPKALAFDLHSQHAKNITGENGNVVSEVSGGLAALRVRRHRVL